MYHEFVNVDENILQFLFSKVVSIITTLSTRMYYFSCTWPDYIQKVHCAIAGRLQTVLTALCALDCVRP